MKNVLVGLMAMILVVSVASMAGAKGLSGKKIFVDPGHGGTEICKVGPTGLKEATVNLRVATVLKNCLQQYGGATVKMSRTSDKTVSLKARAIAANNWKAHRFISVHHNWSPNASVNGTETFSLSTTGNGRDLAKKIQAQLVKWGGLHNRGAKIANFYVLRKTKMSAALSEASFISNPAEEARLRNRNYTWREGYAIYKGICDHYHVGY